MKKLRLLKICTVHLPQGLSYLSNELRLMEWHEYPLKSMPTSFQPEKLVELVMHRSHIKQLPNGFSVSFPLMQVSSLILSLSLSLSLKLISYIYIYIFVTELTQAKSHGPY